MDKMMKKKPKQKDICTFEKKIYTSMINITVSHNPTLK